MKRILCILLTMVLALSQTMDVSAATKKKKVTVDFYNYAGELVDSQDIPKGSNAKDDHKNIPNLYRKNIRFVKWNKSLKNIKKNTKVKAVYREFIPHVVMTYTTNVGDKFQPSVYDGMSKYYNIKWSSSDEKVATVSDTGVITSLSEGTATIEYRATNKKPFKGNWWEYKGGNLTYIFRIELTVNNSASSEVSDCVGTWSDGFEITSKEYATGEVFKTKSLGTTETIKVIDTDYFDGITFATRYYEDEEDDGTRIDYQDVDSCKPGKEYSYSITMNKVGRYRVSVFLLDNDEKNDRGLTIYIDVLN